MAPQLSRVMIIFGVLIVLFIIVRGVAKPESFGWYGHYRGLALTEAAEPTVKHVERHSCADCHDTESAQNLAGPHKEISCQTCHGPGYKHVEEGTAETIVKPEVTSTCLNCHQHSSARPKDFPQIVQSEHSEGTGCKDCHPVHNPLEY